MTTEQTEEVKLPTTTTPGVKTGGFEISAFEIVQGSSRSENFCSLSLETISDSRPTADPLFKSFDGMEVVSEEPLFDPIDSVDVDTQDREAGGRAATEELLIPADVEQEIPLDAAVSGEVAQDGNGEDLTEDSIQPDAEIAAPQSEHERAVAEALEAGIAQGKAQALAESEEHVKAMEQRYAEMIDDMRNQVHEAIDAVEQRAVSLAVRIAGKIMNASVEVNPEYILTIIREAVKVTGGATIKSIRVSPSDYEFISKLPVAKVAKELDSQWKFESDEAIRIGCVVETVAGTVDYDLDKAWDRIQESVSKIR